MATTIHLPVIPINPKEKHAQPIIDYAIEENVLQHVRANRWLAIDLCSFRVVRFNWVVFSMASVVLWAFVVGVLASEKKDSKENGALQEFALWKTWITQNFTWLYIATQVQMLSAKDHACIFAISCLRAEPTIYSDFFFLNRMLGVSLLYTWHFHGLATSS